MSIFRRVPRLAALALLAVTALIGLPVQAATASSVHSSCTVSGCSAAVSAYYGWDDQGWPTSRGWYDWSNGRCNYAGGQYRNDSGVLPKGDTFWEYDVYPRSCGAHRDAYRIVLDGDTGQVWYSPDHYGSFYEIA